MSGSGASNLGYGHIVPNSNINPALVNVDASNYAGGLSSNEIPHSSLYAAKNNIDAANAFIPCPMKGGKGKSQGKRKGKKSLKQKIKNIVKMYKMSRKSKKTRKRKLSRMLQKAKTKARGKSLRAIFRSRTEKRRRGRSYGTTRAFRGGYSQYQNNMPLTPSYSLGGDLAPNLSALANPPPYTVLSGCANCSDNYNHFLGSSFQSRGWGAK